MEEDDNYDNYDKNKELIKKYYSKKKRKIRVKKPKSLEVF